jgi:CheY-like chemotaxis protein
MSSVSETGAEPALGVSGEPVEPPRSEPRFSVLIADDSKVIRTRLVSILETLPGVELRVAADGLEALALARESKPDLLLCDHEMPGMNGIQLLRVLRATWSRFELPILMLTANSATETKVMAFRLRHQAGRARGAVRSRQRAARPQARHPREPGGARAAARGPQVPGGRASGGRRRPRAE